MSENPVYYKVPGENLATIDEIADLTATLHLIIAAQKLAASCGKTTAQVFEEIKTETNVLMHSLSKEQIKQLLDVITEHEFI